MVKAHPDAVVGALFCSCERRRKSAKELFERRSSFALLLWRDKSPPQLSRRAFEHLPADSETCYSYVLPGSQTGRRAVREQILSFNSFRLPNGTMLGLSSRQTTGSGSSIGRINSESSLRTVVSQGRKCLPLGLEKSELVMLEQWASRQLGEAARERPNGCKKGLSAPFTSDLSGDRHGMCGATRRKNVTIDLAIGCLKGALKLAHAFLRRAMPLGNLILFPDDGHAVPIGHKAFDAAGGRESPVRVPHVCG